MTHTSIAVLPFVNLSPDSDDEYFCDGITEEIINALAQIESLKVTSRTSSFHFKKSELSLSEIGSSLEVKSIIEGSVRRSENTVRIKATLVDVEDDSHLWSHTWDRKLNNIFEVQDEISLLIAERLREHVGHFPIDDHLVKTQTDDLNAYEYYLRGKYLNNKWNPIDSQTAIGFFHKSLEIDPNHSESYVGLSDAYGFLAATEVMDPKLAWEKASKYTHKAFALDKNNAGVYYQLANIAFFVLSDFKKAVEYTLKSLEIKPNYPEALQFMSMFLSLAGQHDKAKVYLDRLLEIDPLSNETQFFRAHYLYRTYKFEESIQVFDSILEKNPHNVPAYITKCYALLMLGRFDAVLTFIEKMPEPIHIPGDQLGISTLAYILKKDENKAQELFESLQNEAQKPFAFQAHSYLFLCLITMGEIDRAFDWLEKAIQMKSSVLLISFSSPLIDSVKEDARYQHYFNELFDISHLIVEQKETKKSLLDVESTERYYKKLVDFMEQEQPFLNPNLDLRTLAHNIQIHPNHLSWLINDRWKQNFNVFLNSYRIEHFKKIASNPKNQHISIMGMAYESGFNSKSVFNTHFKKIVGMTPKEFIRKIGDANDLTK